MRETKEKQQGGITLIALIITIVVMLILAGVTINAVVNGGLFQQAQNAVERTKQAQEDELAGIDAALEKIKEVQGEVTVIGGDYSADEGVNTPRITPGMVPVKYTGGKWEVCSIFDPSWYNYKDQASGTDKTSEWANIMLMDEMTTTNYSNEELKGMTREQLEGIAGEEVTKLGSMYVWIPRYAYAITSGHHQSGANINSGTPTLGAGTIKVGFLQGTKEYNTGESVSYKYQGTPGTGTLANASGQDKWNEHPAFTWKKEDGSTVYLSGIWVGKFQASSGKSDITAASGKVAYADLTEAQKAIRTIPGVASWKNISNHNIFNTCLEMSSKYADTYGIKSNINVIDPHMMKNSEWGAAAYLAHSSYGRNGNEVNINNNADYITGYAGETATAGSSASSNGTHPYDNTTYGVLGSTTGNITGIYDMSGASYERTAAYIENTNTGPSGNRNTADYGAVLIAGAERYKDTYAVGDSEDGRTANYEKNASKYGDAVYETSNGVESPYTQSWFADYSVFPHTTSPFFYRGQGYSSGSFAGVFAFGNTTGDAGDIYGFRAVLVAL